MTGAKMSSKAVMLLGTFIMTIVLLGFYNQTITKENNELTEPSFISKKRQENRGRQKHIREYCKQIPRLQRKYSNHQRDKVFISPQKKVAYCKVPKVGTNSWGSFFARAVLGGVKKFEKFFKVKIGNKTLDEVRRKYKVNGMNSIAEVMPLIGSFTGKVEWKKYKSLLVVRHPMERLESLYSNKFSNFRQKDFNTVKFNPTSPFIFITWKIVRGRTTDIGEDFKTSLTPNELVNFVLKDIKRRVPNGRINGHWAPIWRLCPVCLYPFSVYARTENIAEDEKYYKSISGLQDRTGQDEIEHGNSSPRKFSSKEFWDQVDTDKIFELGKEYAYKHDFELFGYSIEDYLAKIGKIIGNETHRQI